MVCDARRAPAQLPALPLVHCRRPRRLGGGKGGESREAKPPKNAPAGSAPSMPSLAALLPPPSADRDRERDRCAARQRPLLICFA
jgi:hypothetical protein